MAEPLEQMKYGIKRFDGKDFILWKMRVENALEASKCDQTIKPNFKIEGTENEIKALKETDIKAKFILMSSITDSVLRKLVTTTALDIWNSLKTRYGETTQANVLVLKRNFLSMKQENNENVESFIDRIKNAREEIEQTGSKITDEDTSMTILFGLLPNYETFVQFITMTNKNTNLDTVIKELIAEDLRRKDKQPNNEKKENEIIFHTQETLKYNKNHSNWKNKKKVIECFNCNKVGHFARNCRLPRANKAANYTEKNTTKPIIEKFSFITDVNKIKMTSEWLLDSGATNHIACC